MQGTIRWPTSGPVGVFAGMANNTYFPAVIAPRRNGESAGVLAANHVRQ